MELLEQLSNSGLSGWLSISMLGFPTLIALHSVGMAIVVGLSFVISLRLCGHVTDIRADRLPRLMQIAAWGFTLNLLTGLALFITRGDEYIASGMFLLKMGIVLASAAIMFRLARHAGTGMLFTGTATRAGTAARTLSLISSFGWFAAVVAGRMIAYLSELY